MAGESATALQADRNKPELGSPITRLDMHMDRLCPITRVEEEPIWPDSKDRRHRSSLPLANDLAVQRRRVAPPAAIASWPSVTGPHDRAAALGHDVGVRTGPVQNPP